MTRTHPETHFPKSVILSERKILWRFHNFPNDGDPSLRFG